MEFEWGKGKEEESGGPCRSTWHRQE